MTLLKQAAIIEHCNKAFYRNVRMIRFAIRAPMYQVIAIRAISMIMETDSVTR